MNKKIVLALALVGAFYALPAQIRTGFKTGLNFARLDGPSETDASGNALESWKNVTGFHIGMTMTHRFTQNFSLRGEVLYSKKGGKYTFETATPGASFKFFQTPSGSVFTRSENVRYLVNTSNSYIDIPVLAMLRWRNFEVSAGASVGFLIASVGDGSATYTGKTATLGNSTGDLRFNLDYNYLKDDPGGFTESSEKVQAKLDAQTIELPKTIGAYFDQTEDVGKMFNTLDVSAIAGLSYYLSRALYAGVRLQYGLSDVTNNKADFSRTKLDSQNKPVLQADKDINYVISVSVGFSF